MNVIHQQALSESTTLYELDGHIQSIYLVKQADKLLLLDGCCRADVNDLSTFIRSTLGLPLCALSLVVVTHMHPDHAGAAHKLRQLTGAKIASANVSGHWYTGLDGILMHITDIALAGWVAKRKGKPRRYLWYSRKLHPDILLDDNDTLPGFPEWQVLFTQGHTDRDLSIYHSTSHKVYVADLMVTVKGRYIPPFPLFYPRRYRESLERIEALNPDSIILAHGGEVHPTHNDYQHLFEKAPKVPLTHWRSVKIKLRKVLFNK
ncbi:MBL fold metallo-hydrolase [Thalassotalea euphylliae]|uniref:MBL fold metallo-hydrolase n=1 Tax=Thalassotalea euphylliae TaxID=1655234 RepID=UPI0036426B19